MENGKVILPRDVAEAIEKLRKSGWDDATLLDRTEFFTGIIDDDSPLIFQIDRSHSGYTIADFLSDDFEKNMPIYARAILNGYEIEKSPEELLREYYEELVETGSAYAYSESYGIVHTLNILGIKIPGINAPEAGVSE
ncbi:DUF1642 domain-containing protein [Fictibacillus sp. Mic-4]|uniref:DUF1642 domain-containing protein n=1 Tax=Fictibacillus sp. Mic-4 TaxID=3132826 RepID=UPI003CEA4B2D